MSGRESTEEKEDRMASRQEAYEALRKSGMNSVDARMAMNRMEKPEEAVRLMNGRDVPKACVDALDEFEKVWPGATFPYARPAIVAAVLDAIGYFDSVQLDGGLYEKVYNQFVIENYYGLDTEPVTPEFFKERWSEMSDEQKAGLIERAKGKGE